MPQCKHDPCHTTGERCKRHALKGREYCKRHGGNSPIGPANGAWKGGRYATKSVPARLMERFEASLNDPDLMDLSREVSMLDARLDELFARIDKGESGAIWKALREADAEMDAAAKKRDKSGEAAALGRVKALIKRGFADNAAWTDIYEAWELRRVHVQTDARIRRDKQESLNPKQSIALVAAMMECARIYVTESTQQRAFQAHLMGILRRDPKQLVSGPS